MAEQPGQPGLSAESLAALARETGASEQQIQEIASLIGNHRPSIVREARMVAAERPKR
jgi:anaerobic selenocysteine-containing dehydrogenase